VLRAARDASISTAAAGTAENRDAGRRGSRASVRWSGQGNGEPCRVISDPPMVVVATHRVKSPRSPMRLMIGDSETHRRGTGGADQEARHPD
jgi:hypothetical protein